MNAVDCVLNVKKSLRTEIKLRRHMEFHHKNIERKRDELKKKFSKYKVYSV